MFDEKWSERHITDSARRILESIQYRADDRGLYVVDTAFITTLVLWSLLLWERKVGRVALERMSIDPFDLAREVDRLLTEKAKEHPVVYDPRDQRLVFAKTGAPYQRWDLETVLEPLLQQAEHEALALGHNYVGSEHLLLAVVQQADAGLTGLLREYGIGYSAVREAVLKVLGS
ncbi:Clp protease N-terminal domain-containing protein [Fimbriiglobus ruber]|uniref:Clp R domain-containing protein n=1 Tax=Fimbriiglobus ruber TaxID=1908690 RepID=A0A225E6I7_9BACT|nr:Clp protease N-terminal domain-containing protein [Fimbriiglobus ruber]OWK45109.1 hypothetical protein FRUB_01440 [Fimbriiglobus ruber]